jgi:hypothetical protein
MLACYVHQKSDVEQKHTHVYITSDEQEQQGQHMYQIYNKEQQIAKLGGMSDLISGLLNVEQGNVGHASCMFIDRL